jgi:hypothetical protein
MTSEERNRRLKYGHDVPRWWIPEFNATHKNPIQRSKTEHGSPPKPDERIVKEHYELKRRSRLITQRRQLSRLNKDIRILQKAIAALFVVIGILAGGLIGFFVGTCIGLAVLAIRLEL